MPTLEERLKNVEDILAASKNAKNLSNLPSNSTEKEVLAFDPSTNKIVKIPNLLDNKAEKGGYDGTAQDLKDEIDNKVFTGVVTYKSLALAQAVSPTPQDGTSFKVRNSAISGENGNYFWDNGVTVKDDFSEYVESSKIVEELPTIGSDNLISSGKIAESNELLVGNFDKSLTQKINKVLGTNKSNPNEFRYGSFMYSGGSTIHTGNNTYGMTGLIPVSKNGLVTVGAGTSTQGLLGQVVYDINVKSIRSVPNTNQYTYQNGDEYVAFCYQINGDLDFANKVGVIEGTNYVFEKYTDNKPLTELQDKVAVVEEYNNVEKILNGTTIQRLSSSDFVNNLVITARDSITDTLTFFKENAGSWWSHSETIDFTGTDLIHIKFNVEFTRVGGHTKGLVLYVAKGGNPSAGYYSNVGTVLTNGDVGITIDPVFHRNASGEDELRFWLANEDGMTTGQSITALIQGLEVTQDSGSFVGDYVKGENTKAMFKTVDDTLKVFKEDIVAASTTEESDVGSILNGNTVTHLVSSNFYDNLFITNRNLENDILTLYKSGTGNSWTYSDLIEATGTESVHIKFNVQFTRTGAHTKGLQVYVAVGGSPGAGFFQVIDTVRDNGDVDITYDPAYYSQYHGIDSLRIWLWNETMEAGQTMTALVTGLTAVQYKDSVEGVYIDGSTAKELFQSVDLAIGNTYSAIASSSIKVNPFGDKYEIGVDTFGNIVARPIIPTKAAFFGNSLITGWNVTFGMASSAQDKDYYYLVTEAIKGLNPAFTSIRGNQGSYEDIDESKSEASIQASIDNAFLNKLDGDEDLVCFQLGDNVNNASRVAMFGQTSLQLLQQVRTKCPNARVFWMGMWYSSTEKYQAVQESCAKTGSTFISFSGLVTPENVSAIGKVSNLGVSGVRTLESVTGVVENTPTNITVSFDYFGEPYESTVDVVSYNLSSTTLTYTSDYVIINDAGIASHPGDSGMKAIANRFLYQSGISDVKEFYT